MANAYEKQVYKFVRIFALLIGVSLFGTLGFHFLEGWSLLDSLYMTVITLTTVGFGEVRMLDDAGRWFTIVLMISSVGIVAYSVTTIASLVELVKRVATESTHPDREYVGCWFCISDEGDPHEKECPINRPEVKAALEAQP